MTDIAAGQTLTDRTTFPLRETLAGRRRGVGTSALFAGPAVIASIVYVDPDNLATNIGLARCGMRPW